MSISEHNNNIESNPQDLVQVRIIGLGHIDRKEPSLVALLSPTKGQLLKLKKGGKRLIFPIVFPPELAFLYVHRISKLEHKHPPLSNLLDYYCHYTKCTISHISIIKHHGMIKGFVSFETKEGWNGRFEADLPNLIYTSIKYKIKIFIEESLLVEAAVGIKANAPILDSSQRVPQISSIDIYGYIVDGVLPDEVDDNKISDIPHSMYKDEIGHLIEIAIEYEQYEWADILEKYKEQADEFEF